jgi:hypothetical protein
MGLSQKVSTKCPYLTFQWSYCSIQINCKHKTSLLSQWLIWPSPFSCLSPLVASTWPLHLLHASNKSGMQWLNFWGLELIAVAWTNVLTCPKLAEQVSLMKNNQGTDPHQLLEGTLNKSMHQFSTTGRQLPMTSQRNCIWVMVLPMKLPTTDVTP